MSTRATNHTLMRDETLGRQAEAVLRAMILGGEIAPGERLNELALSADLGVSRGPLREAVQRLRGEGLLTVVSHRGAYVRTFEADEIDDLYGVRAALELHAIRILCRRESTEWVGELDAMLHETAAELQVDGAQYPQQKDFHLRLVSLAGSPALLERAVETHHQLSLARTISARSPQRARTAIGEHRDIVEALKTRDAATAMDVMEEHLEHARQSARDALGIPAQTDHGKDRG